jgi:hypothetical protein
LLLTVERHRLLSCWGIRVRVWLDGRDRSDDCLAADNAYGYVVVARRDAEGRKYLDARRGTLAVELRTGAVRFATPRGDLPTRWWPSLWFTFPRCSTS